MRVSYQKLGRERRERKTDSNYDERVKKFAEMEAAAKKRKEEEKIKESETKKKKWD